MLLPLFYMKEATSLLNDARHVMERISKAGKGITRHDVSANGGRPPLSIGRVLATFETGQEKNESVTLNAREEFVLIIVALL